MKILFDTNLWISFMIGKRLSSLADVLCRHDVEVYICEQELDEIRRVIAPDHRRQRRHERLQRRRHAVGQ